MRYKRVPVRTLKEIRLYKDEREIRARSGTGGGHKFIKERGKEKEKSKGTSGRGHKPGRVLPSLSFFCASLPLLAVERFFFSLSHACKTHGNESSLPLDACLWRTHMPCVIRKYGMLSVWI